MRLIKLLRVKEPKKSGGFKTFMVDLIEVSATEYQVRAFQVSEAKFTYGVSYGHLKKFRHTLDSDGERRVNWGEDKFETQAAAEEFLDKSCLDWKGKGSLVIVPRKQKLYL